MVALEENLEIYYTLIDCFSVVFWVELKIECLFHSKHSNNLSHTPSERAKSRALKKKRNMKTSSELQTELDARTAGECTGWLRAELNVTF